MHANSGWGGAPSHAREDNLNEKGVLYVQIYRNCGENVLPVPPVSPVPPVTPVPHVPPIPTFMFKDYPIHGRFLFLRQRRHRTPASKN